MKIKQFFEKKVSMLKAILGLVSFLLCSPQVFAVQLDQFYMPNLSSVIQARSIDWQGQSFTAGVSGILDGVGALIRKENGVTADLDFILFPIIGNMALVSQGVTLSIPTSLIPVGNFGASQPYTLADMMFINLASSNFQVTAGSQYGMLVHSTIGFNERPMINWFAGCGNNSSVQCGFSNVSFDGYTLGSPLQTNVPLTDFPNYVRTDFDLTFATYVIAPVPEPETYAMMLVGIYLIGGIAKRRGVKQV